MENLTLRAGRVVAAVLIALATACGGSDSTQPPAATTGVLAGSVIDVDSGALGLSGVGVRLESAGGTRNVTTDGAGSFRVTDAAAGTWRAEVQVPGTHRLDAGASGSQTATVTANGTATVPPFRLARPRGAVSGQVLFEGAGIASGVVTARRGGFGNRTASPVATGNFTIDALAVGPWTLEYTAGAGYRLGASETGTRSVTVAENQTATVTAFNIRTQATSTVVEIHLTASTFSPASVTIAPGTTVRWINDAAISHTITPENGSQAGVWQRRTTSTPGVVFEHTFSVSGQTYRYRCEPHSSDFESGMVGVIIVT